ncbi:ATP-dependent DNA helicase Q-like 3 [Cryptosporidium felis]|nr:ATP-dependent DNA helicase Q-like 3 [Cryptosporidium felis]
MSGKDTAGKKWKQSSLNGFVGMRSREAAESEEEFDEDDENSRFSRQLESTIEAEKAQEDRVQELFCRYKLKADKARRPSKASEEDWLELKKGLKWALRHIGLEDYRTGQEEAINHLVCERKDVVLILPTGGGKSLTYQLPSLLRKYQSQEKEIPSLSKGMVTVVVSPLIALIEDQINSLRKWGVRSNGLSSAIIQKSDPSQSVNAALQELYSDLERAVPTCSIIYVTPESFGTEKVLDCLLKLYRNGNLYSFAVDEAHCISEWGHDFRTAYRRLSQIKHIFQDVPVLACTATASPKVRKDIMTVLGLRDPFVSVNSFNRPNIHYTAYNVDVNDYLADLDTEEIVLNAVLYLHESFGKTGSEDPILGIVYVNSRKLCDHLSQFLTKNGVPSKSYHAGLSLKTRTQIQNEWLENKIQVLVGTIAFGMGVHKPNVRFVIHSSIPDSIDSYYQQSGRAGRDSRFSRALLFYSKRDISCLKSIKKKSLQYLYLKSPEKAQQAFEKFQDNLQSVLEFAQCNASESSHLEEDHHQFSHGDLQNVPDSNSGLPRPKPQSPSEYQSRINKYGQCRRRFLLGYFGEKLSRDKRSPAPESVSPGLCCDVCDSRLPNSSGQKSFMVFMSSLRSARNSLSDPSRRSLRPTPALAPESWSSSRALPHLLFEREAAPAREPQGLPDGPLPEQPAQEEGPELPGETGGPREAGKGGRERLPRHGALGSPPTPKDSGRAGPGVSGGKNHGGREKASPARSGLPSSACKREPALTSPNGSPKFPSRGPRRGTRPNPGARPLPTPLSAIFTNSKATHL